MLVYSQQFRSSIMFTSLVRVLAVALLAFTSICGAVVQQGSVPLIHCTDILYPPDDPDDYFDLASIHGTSEFDLKLVVLDQGEKQVKRPGSQAVDEMNAITGRKVPCAIGLNERLRSTTDTALSQARQFQGGVEGILSVLRASKEPVTVSVVGSARDMAAAFNREPDLFRKKIRRIYVFCGEASDPKFTEWNVAMDPFAFAALMRSGLPICWIPCFDKGDWKNGGHASFWQTTQSELLKNAPGPLLQYFITATQPLTSSPLEYLHKPVDAHQKEKLFAGPRNMWGGALLALMAGRQLEQKDGGWVTAPGHDSNPSTWPKSGELVGFSEVQTTFDDAGHVKYGTGNRMLRIDVKQPKLYGPAMTEATADLLGRVPVAEKLRK